MARAPFIVFVYPYVKVGDNEFEYALLKSADRGSWEGVAGGGEGNETLQEAARRETYEETGIRIESPLIQLDTVAPVPVTRSRESYLWGDDVYVIPLHYFGILADNRQIRLSAEHVEYMWLRYQDARNLLKFDDDKIAL
ncbi:MAG: NUDIX domain-containing protein [Chloroflexi bacterium]|nr:NUDIX domain-containing protein [Chloroflexota bacterium]